MKVLLLGSNGMLGQAVKKELRSAGHTVKETDRSNADYCFDLLNDDKLFQSVQETNPDVIINTAAAVSLEYCENHPGDAYCLNSRLPGVLADICREQGCYAVHISTDHFYYGDGRYLHSETDPVRLVNEYARTKYAGEIFAMTYPQTLVLRTNIVGFRCRGQQTFVEWALDEVQKKQQMTLFTDFYTSSIHTADFAKVLLDLMGNKITGIYNLGARTASSKKEFILKLSEQLLGFIPDYIEKSVRQLKGVPRGDSLGLDTERIEKAVGYRMPSLDETIESLKKEYTERKLYNEL